MIGSSSIIYNDTSSSSSSQVSYEELRMLIIEIKLAQKRISVINDENAKIELSTSSL
jgi:hypothetical protein